MPYKVKANYGGCTYAVVKDDGEVVGCHKSKAEASAHVRALYANVPDASKGYGGKKKPMKKEYMGCGCETCKEMNVDCPDCPVCSPEMNKAQGPCWEGYEMVGWKRKNGKRVPNCVPKDSTKKNAEVGFEIDESHPRCEGVALVEINGTSVLCYPDVAAAQAALLDMARADTEASMRPQENEGNFWEGTFK